MSFILRCRRTFFPAVVLLAALGLGARSAQAGVLVENAADCESQSLSQPFIPWADFANYTPLSGATFESGAPGWSLDGAAVSAGNEPYEVAGDDGESSLALPAGSTATSPAICVGLAHPTIRFFAKRNGGGLLGALSMLRVDVVYENSVGLFESLPIGFLPGTPASWQLTPTYLVVANLLPLLPGDRTAVAFRFTPVGTANWSIDDVFVDPWRSN